MQSTQEGICQNLCGRVEGIQPSWNKGGPRQGGKAWPLPSANSWTSGPLWGHTVYEKGSLQRAGQIRESTMNKKLLCSSLKEKKPLEASVGISLCGF